MDVIDIGHARIPLLGHRIKAALQAHAFKGSGQFSHIVHRGARAHVIIAVQHNITDIVISRDDGFGEAPFIPGFRRAGLAFDRERIHIGPAVA